MGRKSSAFSLFTVKIHLLATDPHGHTQTFCSAEMAGQKQYAPKEHRQFIRWCVHQWIRSFVCVRLCVSSKHSERVAFLCSGVAKCLAMNVWGHVQFCLCRPGH